MHTQWPSPRCIGPARRDPTLQKWYTFMSLLACTQQMPSNHRCPVHGGARSPATVLSAVHMRAPLRNGAARIFDAMHGQPFDTEARCVAKRAPSSTPHPFTAVQLCAPSVPGPSWLQPAAHVCEPHGAGHAVSVAHHDPGQHLVLEEEGGRRDCAG